MSLLIMQKSNRLIRNANLIIKSDGFKWRREPVLLESYTHNRNWISSFCMMCGSKAPVSDIKNDLIYVPAGSIENDQDLTIKEHVNLSSKANWDI